MSDSPFIPFYTSDFLAGTGGMTSSAKGVYITLLCLMYESEGPLTQSYETLARRSGCTTPAFKRAIEMLADDGKITVLDSGLWSEKCEKHITQRRERSISAAASAKKRWEKSKQKQGADDAKAMQAQCKPEPDTEDTSPKGEDGQAVDFTKEVFDRGVAFLSKYGTAERQARSLIGKWRKDAGDTETFNALRDANREGVSEPVAWITARLRPRENNFDEIFAQATGGAR